MIFAKKISRPLHSLPPSPFPPHGRFALLYGDESNSTEKSNLLAALGFSAADLAGNASSGASFVFFVR